MKETMNAKEIRERVKELLNTRKVISVKVRTTETDIKFNTLDYIVHHSVYVLTTDTFDYKLTEYYYQNSELVSITGEVYIHDIERMKKLFKN